MELPVGLRNLGARTFLFLAIALCVYLLYVVSAIAAGRHLYGDASWVLIRLLTENRIARDFADWHEFFGWRIGAFACRDLPVLLASNLGIANLGTLSIIYGATMFAFKPLGLVLCYFFARDKRFLIFPLFGLFAATVNSEGYIITETHLFTALFWAALFGLLFCDLRGWRLAALLVVSLPLILCYEAMALFGLILCAACVYRMRTRPEKRVPASLGIWYLAGSVLGVLSTIYPRDPSTRSGFIRSLLFVFTNDHIGARASCLILLIAAAVLMIPASRRGLLDGLTALGIAAAAAIPLYSLTHPEATSLNVQLMARTMNVTVTAILVAAFLAVYFHRIAPGVEQYQRLFVIVSALAIGQSLWHFQATLQWTGMRTVLREDLDSHAGPLRFENSRMSQWFADGRPIRNMHADWPLPSLSILTAPAGRVRTIVLAPAGAFEPFDPLNPKALPDLARFGVDYREYIAALPKAASYTLGDWISFDANGHGTDYQTGKGWWNAEAWGKWASDDAALQIPVPSAPPSGLVLETYSGAFVTATHPSVDVEVLVNDRPVGVWRFQYRPGAPPYDLHRLDIPADVRTIRFRTAGARSPLDVGLSADPRKLGFALSRLRLVAR